MGTPYPCKIYISYPTPPNSQIHIYRTLPVHLPPPIYESRFFKDGLALAPVPDPVPFVLLYRPELPGRAAAGPPAEPPVFSSVIPGVAGRCGSRLRREEDGDARLGAMARSTGYIREGGPGVGPLNECWGEKCAVGGDPTAPYGRPEEGGGG